MKKVYVCILKTACLFCLASNSFSLQAATPANEFVSIFNGKNLDGWDGDTTLWRVKDGAIFGESTAEAPLKHNSFITWRYTIDDFELKLKYKLTHHNSGIQYRSTLFGQYRLKGYQADMSFDNKWTGACYEEGGRGLLAKPGQKSTYDQENKKTIDAFVDTETVKSYININDWNEYHIIARGNHVIHKINGHVTSVVIDGSAKHSLASGLLGFQMHRGPPMTVAFKDILLKRLPLEGKKKVVLVAGRASHGWNQHEHNAGVKLLAEKINTHMSDQMLAVTYHDKGFPKDPTAFDNADCVVIYCDGGSGHLLNKNLDTFQKVMDRQVGLVQLHYAVETPKGIEGEKFLGWMGGYFESDWSVNPHWTAKFNNLPNHPITNGVEPFEINDEWYYHMRFVENLKGVVPILSDLPSKKTLSRKDGSHSGNPDVRKSVLEKKEAQHVAWSYDRENKGRSFGFTGGHFHVNWANDSFRKIVLNSIAWCSHVEVPENGFDSATPTPAELEANQDYPKPKKK